MASPATERTPLIRDLESPRLSDDDVDKLELLGKIRGDDGDTNPGYEFARSFSVRVAAFASLMACIVWVPAFGKPFPPDIPNYMPLVCVLFFFTITPMLGSTVRNAVIGVWGTFLACFHMWVMQGIYPGGVDHGPGMDKVQIFGWVNMLGFLWLVLWSKCGLAVKMFALSYDVGFMLNFLNPDSTVPFSENFTISSRGTAVNCMIATFIAVTVAIIANLVPYPHNTAFATMKEKSMSVSHKSARLFLGAIDYYNGASASLVIVNMQEHEKRLQAELGSLGEAIDAAYYEGFDQGDRAIIRSRTEAHHQMMLSVNERLKAIMISLETEGFEPTHIAIMREIKAASTELALATEELLIDCSYAMCADGGVLQANDALRVNGKSDRVHKTVQDLSRAYDVVRKKQPSVISEDVLGESFFVLTLSAYARLVMEYADLLVNAPAIRPASIADDIMANVSSTFDMKAMMHEYNLNFSIRYFAAIFASFCYCVYFAKWDATCVVISSVLINFNVGTDILSMVNTLSAVVMAGVLPPIVLNVTCRTASYLEITGYLLPWVAAVYWIACLYPVYSKSQFALLGILAAALGAFSLVNRCATVDIGGVITTDGVKIVHMVFAVLINGGCEMLMGVLWRHRSCVLAADKLDQSFECLQESLQQFFHEEDLAEAIAPVAGHLNEGLGFNRNATIEPRFWRIDWKDGLYEQTVNLLFKLRLDLLMLNAGAEMTSSKAEGGSLLALVSHHKDWDNIVNDLNRTLSDGRRLCKELLSHESGKFNGVSHLHSVTDIDILEDLPALITSLMGSLKFPEKAPSSMEDDKICKVSVILVMLQSACAHMGQVVKLGVSKA